MDTIVKARTLKNELNYNPTTWAEWTKNGAVGDATGLELTANGSTVVNAKLYTQLKTGAKYGVLWNVASSTAVKTPYITGTEAVGAVELSKTAGNGKAIATAKATIATNAITIQSDPETSGNKIKLRDIRIFELPTGSEIESDFTNLTADELAVKYPYIQGGEIRGTGAVTLTSTGKNLFDKSATFGTKGYLDEAGVFFPDRYISCLGLYSSQAVNCICGSKYRRLINKNTRIRQKQKLGCTINLRKWRFINNAF